jgi:hypothetical protein
VTEHMTHEPRPAMTRCAGCDAQVWTEPDTPHIHLNSAPQGPLAHLQGRCHWLCDDCWAALARTIDDVEKPC